MGGRKRERDFAWEFISDIKNSNQRRHTIDTQILSHAMLFREAFHAKIVACSGK